MLPPSRAGADTFCDSLELGRTALLIETALLWLAWPCPLSNDPKDARGLLRQAQPRAPAIRLLSSWLRALEP